MAHQTYSTNPFQSFKHPNPINPQMRFNLNHPSRSRSLASQTMPDLRLFQSEPGCEDQSKQYASCLPDTLDWEMAGPTPSPVNTASSPSFSGSPLPTFPFLADGSSKHDKEMEELEYERSEADDRPTGFVSTAVDDDQSMCDDDEEEEDDDDDASTVAPGQNLREPPLNASLLFEYPTDSSELPTLSSEDTILLSDSINTSLSAISHTLGHYRIQLEIWEKDHSASSAVHRASALINQCLIRVERILDPVWDRIVRRLMDFDKEFSNIQQILSDSKLITSKDDQNPTALNELCVLGDQCSTIEGSISDLSQNLNDLYEWTDAYLTPTLAELTPTTSTLNSSTTIPKQSNDERVSEVSQLLDAHSYLCVGLDKLSNNMKLVQITFKILSDACQNLPQLILHESDGLCLENDRFDKFRIWIKESRTALVPIIEAMSTLASHSGSNTWVSSI